MAKKEEKKDIQLPTPALPAIVQAVGVSVAPVYATAQKEYDVTQHDVFNQAVGFRPKKKVRTLRKDAEGKPILDKNGKNIYDTKRIEVNRIGVPLQELIVKRRVSFMNVSKIQLEANPQTEHEKRLYQMIKKMRDDNKIAFIEKEVARRMLSELQVAKLWYSESVEPGYWGDISSQGKFKMRCKVLSPELGDTLLPVFDDFGKMIYFGRIYQSSRSFADLIADPNFSGLTADKEDKFDVYSATHIYKFRKAKSGEDVLSTANNNGWIVDSITTHSYGKIPVTYYSKPMPPWAPVQAAIARIETLISNVGDTNDYHASPVFAMFGKVGAKVLEKGEQGKSLQIEGEGADARYVTWEQAIDAVEFELNTLMNYIFTCTQTPQMAMEDLKGLGALSGVAFDRVFQDAHLAARDEIDGEYGMSTQRDINLQIAFCGAIDTTLKAATKTLSIGFDIPIYRINDDSETVDLLQKAAGGSKVISQKTAIEYSPLTKNADEELKQIQKEEALIVEKEKKEEVPDTQ
ncbi:phage portal protein [Sphingobacterium sp. UT-1RO-CII-1]|uniref:phage portal protein n=1 Tax=Sphingobacterium sp. UT-1RO-CII-1 TaxID=2995225 RepID=UPI00227A44A6|nr:phage portal protein [Sphingobacterium sp. UT-1RO-CII-1]MCY4781432.1 phage portal protein [Sphingobacterium sp. UT-1RO-CII-1]